MQIARTGYLAAYSLIPDATSKAWLRRRDILPPRMLSATRPSPRRVKLRTLMSLILPYNFLRPIPLGVPPHLPRPQLGE
jgi:hypothetical protein